MRPVRREAPVTRHAEIAEYAESGIVRLPADAISRPLAERSDEGVGSGFIAEQRLADLLFRRRIRRAGPGLIQCDGSTFEIYEAVRVLGPMHGQSDPYGLTGIVEHLEALTKAGASFSGTAMHLGSTCYQIVRGVVALARNAERAG